jgi:hypothetical protein
MQDDENGSGLQVLQGHQPQNDAGTIQRNIKDPKAKFVAEIIAAGTADLKALLKGHGLGSKVAFLSERPDVLGLLGTLAWTLKARSKGVNSLRKTSNFKFVAYKNYKDLSRKLDKDIQKFMGSFENESFDEYFNDNVVIYAIIQKADTPLIGTLVTDAKFDIAAKGQAAVLTYDQATDPSFGIPGAIYLAAFVSDEAIFSAEAAKAQTLASRNKKLTARKTAAKVRAKMAKGKITSNKWKIKLKSAFLEQSGRMIRGFGGGTVSKDLAKNAALVAKEVSQLGKKVQSLYNLAKSSYTATGEYSLIAPILRKIVSVARSLQRGELTLGDAKSMVRNYQRAASGLVDDTSPLEKLAQGVLLLDTRSLKAAERFTDRKGYLKGNIQILQRQIAQNRGLMASETDATLIRGYQKVIAAKTRKIALNKQRLKAYGRGGDIYAKMASVEKLVYNLQARNVSTKAIIERIVKTLVPSLEGQIAANKTAIAEIKAGGSVTVAISKGVLKTLVLNVVKTYLSAEDVLKAFSEQNRSILQKVVKIVNQFSAKNGYNLSESDFGDDYIYDIIYKVAPSLGWRHRQNSGNLYNKKFISEEILYSDYEYLLSPELSKEVITNIKKRALAAAERAMIREADKAGKNAQQRLKKQIASYESPDDFDPMIS